MRVRLRGKDRSPAGASPPERRPTVSDKADPFASAVQRSPEQKARGQLAVGHVIAAEVLRPKPVSPEPKK